MNRISDLTRRLWAALLALCLVLALTLPVFAEGESETADTAVSPALATITVSAMPVITAKNCSPTSGQISRRSAGRENSGVAASCVSVISILFSHLFYTNFTVKFYAF